MKTVKGAPRQVGGSSLLSAAEAFSSRPLSTLSDTELLRYGMVLKRRTFALSHSGTALASGSLSQWRELRREWQKRYPELPLSATFDDQFG